MSTRKSLAAVLVVLLCTAAAPATASASTNATTAEQDAGAFIVDLKQDGSARVTLQLTYDLDSDAEKEAFQDLKNNETLQQQTKQNFLERMRRVAASAENETGREMSVSNAAIAFETTNDGSVGLVRLSVTWTGLAATDGETLTVTEPFASGFEPNRTFTVSGPDGYTLQSATPAPATKGDNSATWAAGTDLSGFQVVFAPAETTTTETATETATETTAGGGPGFGLVVTLLALVAATLVARRQR